MERNSSAMYLRSIKDLIAWSWRDFHRFGALTTFRPSPAVLCHFQTPTGTEQLQQIAHRAHQLPLAADVLLAAQAEAAKTALFLDLSKDRLDDRLAHLVHRASSFALQLAAHRLFRRCIRGRRIVARLHRVAMLVAARRHV